MSDNNIDFQPNTLAIVGSRNFKDLNLFTETIDKVLFRFPSIVSFVSGGANGADKFAEYYAKNHNIKINIIYPDWNTYGKKAGFLRNIDIIDLCDLCIAFWDGISKGTKNDIDLCKQKNKPYIIINF